MRLRPGDELNHPTAAFSVWKPRRTTPASRCWTAAAPAHRARRNSVQHLARLLQKHLKHFDRMACRRHTGPGISCPAGVAPAVRPPVPPRLQLRLDRGVRLRRPKLLRSAGPTQDAGKIHRCELQILQVVAQAESTAATRADSSGCGIAWPAASGRRARRRKPRRVRAAHRRLPARAPSASGAATCSEIQAVALRTVFEVRHQALLGGTQQRQQLRAQCRASARSSLRRTGSGRKSTRTACASVCPPATPVCAA